MRSLRSVAQAVRSLFVRHETSDLLAFAPEASDFSDYGSQLSDIDLSDVRNVVGYTYAPSVLSDILSDSVADSSWCGGTHSWVSAQIAEPVIRPVVEPNQLALRRIIATVHGVTPDAVQFTITRLSDAVAMRVVVVLPWGSGTVDVPDAHLRTDDRDAVWAEAVLAAAARCAETAGHAQGRAIALEGIEK